MKNGPCLGESEAGPKEKRPAEGARWGNKSGSDQEVDEMMKKVLSTGGKEAREPQDYGFMYGRTLEDPDGHIWEVFWMDESRKPLAG